VTRPRIAETLSGTVDEAKSRIALRGATVVGTGTRVFGWPQLARQGQLAIGRRVVLVSTPAPITLLVAPGGSLVIGDGVLIESGATVRARGRVVIGHRARLGVGCILDDDGPGQDITVNDGAWVEDGAVLLGGAVVPAHGVVKRDRSVADSAKSGDAPAEPTAEATGIVGRRVRTVVSRVVTAAGSVDAGTDLAHVKGWDSLAALRVLVALEKEFGISLPSDLLANHPTLQSIMPWVMSSARTEAEAR
jgi:acyl carrier protein/acetyltransferase-like isoleucine patch superfamily enzyme